MNRNGVNFYTRERATSNDFDRAFSGISKNLMDTILAANPSFGTTVEKSAVINGFNVTGIDGRTITIGEGLGYVIDTESVDDYESRARLIAVGPSRTDTPAEITIEIPANASAHPRLVLVYLYPDTTDVTELRDVYNSTTRLFEPSSQVKYSIVSASAAAMSGEPAAIPELDRAWNPLDADPVEPWPESYLRLYAVYQKAGKGGNTLSAHDIIDLRWYNDGSNYSVDNCELSRNPRLQTAYTTSVQDTSNFITWKPFNGVISGQRFYIPVDFAKANLGETGMGNADAFSSTQDTENRYFPDKNLLTAENRNNRPVYFYALSHIGAMIDANNLSSQRTGYITCCLDAPGSGLLHPGDSQRVFREWNMACGEDHDHYYTIPYATGLFIGSMLVGKNGSGDYMIYGCRRDGNKVWITEENTDADLPQAGGPVSVGPTDIGINIMEYEDDDSICGRYKFVNLGGPAVYGGLEAQLMEALPRTAKSITLDLAMFITNIDGTTIRYRLGDPRIPGVDGAVQGLAKHYASESYDRNRVEIPMSEFMDGDGDWPEWRKVHIAFFGDLDCDPGTDRFVFKMIMTAYTESIL